MKQQIIAFKSCYNLEVSTVMSSKNDPAIGQLADLLSRLKHILNMINNNNIQRMNVLPHSITSKNSIILQILAHNLKYILLLKILLSKILES